jgi:hypothetical protein
MTMITAYRAIGPADRAQAFRARHAAYCLAAGGKAPLITCPAQAPWKPHDPFDDSPHTLLYCVRDGSTVVGSSRLIGNDPQLGLQVQHFLTGRALGLGLSETMEPSRLALIPAYKDKERRQHALLALFSVMYDDSLHQQCTRWVATVRGLVFLLLSGMKIAITLLDDEPIRPGAGGTVDGPLSGEPLFLVAIDLTESAAWLFTDNSLGFQIICKTDQPPVRYAEAQIQQLRTRARSDLAIVARHMHQWRTTQAGTRPASTDTAALSNLPAHIPV